MRGRRWNLLGKAYNTFLGLLKDMPHVIVSTLTFDDNTTLFYKELTPTAALEKKEKLPFTGLGTSYSAALKMVIELLEKCSGEYAGYLGNILFFSDGRGDSPDAELAQLSKMKAAGKTIVINTIACETEEDDDLIKLTTTLQGNHYSTTSASALSEIFQKIINLT